MSKEGVDCGAKFQEIVAYLFEFGYDLALSPENDVSRSPGFELILGIFGG
jgi:hypothetical protein